MRASTTSRKIKSNIKPKQKLAFDAQAFLDSAGVSRKVKEFKRAEAVYAQGDAAESVMYLQSGGVKLTVVNEVGKEAVVAILAPGDFFGEGCLAGQPVRIGTATAITPTTVLVIEKSEMFKVLHEEHGLSDRVHQVHAGTEHSDRGGLGRSAFQFEREAARPHSSIARPLRQRRPASRSSPQDVARNAGGDDRHDALPSQLFHEQIQETGLHSIQQWRIFRSTLLS